MVGVFFCKIVDLSSTQGALCTASVFFILNFTYLGGGCVRIQRTPAYGPAIRNDVSATTVSVIFHSKD